MLLFENYVHEVINLTSCRVPAEDTELPLTARERQLLFIALEFARENSDQSSLVANQLDIIADRLRNGL